MRALKESGVDGVAVIVGGIVPDADEAMLVEAGVARVFHPGSSLDDISDYIRSIVPALRRVRSIDWKEEADA
jgi:methylmalonyl-CoA mutase C-terminal domain/subunit